MLIYNATAQVQLVKGRDLYGQPTHARPIPTPCAVVALHRVVTKTGVRTDATATRGGAEEQTENARILFPPNSKIIADARVVIQGHELRVIDVHRRFDVNGRLDHLDCMLTLWAEPGR